MNENYRLYKEYKITPDILREAYRSHQKKKVYPKSYAFMGIFLFIAAVYAAAAVQAPDNMLTYVLIFICLALACREWYNPRKLRRNLVEAAQELGDVVYRLTIDEACIEISTVDDAENDEQEQKTAATKIPLESEITIDEYDDYILLYDAQKMIYIIPKEYFNETELDILRSIK